MKTTPEYLNKKLPAKIREHLIFKAFEPEKIFPKIGLANSKKSLNKKSLSKYSKNFAINYIEIVKHEISGIIRDFPNTNCCYYHKYDNYGGYTRILDNDKLLQRKNLLKVLKSLYYELKNNPNSFISTVRNRIKFKIPKTIEAGGFVLKQGKSLKEEYLRLSHSVRLRFAIKIDFPNTDVNSDLFLNTKNIVFSSDGKEGLWDIATMSMRGIRSCQRWNSSHSRCLIGSMIDPYLGVLYLTKGKTKYGSKMVYRAVIRFVLRKTDNKPAIMIERIYPFDYDSYGKSKTAHIYNLFSDFIKEKTKNKYPIVNGQTDSDVRKYFIPLSEPVEYLKNDEKSYRDSEVPYKKINKNITNYLQ